jgi:hypothetical protein
MGTTVKPASSSASTINPDGRSMAMAVTPAPCSRRHISLRPAASWRTSRRKRTAPRSSMTHTAWLWLAQSSPAKQLLMDTLLRVAL